MKLRSDRSQLRVFLEDALREIPGAVMDDLLARVMGAHIVPAPRALRRCHFDRARQRNPTSVAITDPIERQISIGTRSLINCCLNSGKRRGRFINKDGHWYLAP